ncbi:MAG: aminopeptidase [Oscillospiraceae bacterium]|nr:aminopeptidase [Oscillospiraceae bacterium]
MTKQEKYARLLIDVGVNVQKGQDLVISAQVETASFVRLCAAYAYEKGAREVVMNWSDDLLTREKYEKAADDVFDAVPEHMKLFMDSYSQKKAAFLFLSSTDPENLKNADTGRIRRWQTASAKAMKIYRTMQADGELQWCIAAVPSVAWAKKVFPDRTESEALSALWEAILKTVYVTADGDAEADWNAHIRKTDERAAALTAYNFKALRYKNALGTDLTVELAAGHKWSGGAEITKDGIPVSVNMPTEEVFCPPKKYGANGVVFASMPLVIGGALIDRFRMTLRDGKIVDVKADVGEDILRGNVYLDEGSCYLGEVALVPYDSPISNQGILFYDTLFDENASCHIAFGSAIASFTDTDAAPREEYEARGINDSDIHIDFMVGTPDLSITGIRQDGSEVPVFVDGNFAF